MSDAAMRQDDAKIWGQDIALGVNGQAKVAANGELILTDGTDTGLQDIALRLYTYLGTLFYDLDFGSLLPDWFYEESTPLTRATLLSEITQRIEADPRVTVGSVRCKLLGWNEKGVSVQAEWRFIDEDHPFNLVLQLDKSAQEAGSTCELLISDGRHSEPLAWGKVHEGA